MYAPMLENGSELQASLDACSASVQEFQIPPKAFLGLHSYCPIHFDSFHAVLVGISLHIPLLRAAIHAPSSKVPNNFHATEDVAGENLDGSIQVFKASFAVSDRLLEEPQKLSKTINQTIDSSDFISKLNDTRMVMFHIILPESNCARELHGTIFCKFEKRVEKCILIAGFANKLQQVINGDMPTVCTDMEHSRYYSEKNWASIFRTSLLSCKGSVWKMTDDILPDVIKSFVSFNSEVTGVSGSLSQIRGSIDMTPEQLVEVEIEIASLVDLE
ncbi:hypothetical protein VitviT2T_030261 [Vitis vinifera]|uniref:Uncharacterized protein n=1 Tax=Vitis vinifera TaxID=29760 RepID=A0ABY9DZ43_VITVI|nr:hypothetical protein VitviT2T_030261 [Vitis vinifera]